MIIRGAIFCASMLTFINVIAQNIVPNSSFEEHTECPNTNGQIHNLTFWYGVGGSPDYYHGCGSNGWSVPLNWGGDQDAYYGEAYSGIVVWHTISNAREFISVKLIQSLIPEKKYAVEFYMSLMDSMWYASKNIGAFFSVDSIAEQMNPDFFFSKTPQIKYTGTDYLADKEGWMKVEGSFFADGGEQFMTIGNFDDDEHTDTLFIGEATGGFIEKRQSYYYIDDISVELDTLTGLEEYDRVKFEVYPNPAKEILTIETEQTNKTTTLQLFDVTGRIVLSVALSNTKISIDISQLPAGVYVAALLQDEAIASRRKIIIE